MSSINSSILKTLAIGLGSNIPSPIGSPETTLIKARPLIKIAIQEWCCSWLPTSLNNSIIKSELDFQWSPLYKTEPIGGPKEQPDFINAVLIAHGNIFTKIEPCIESATDLLNRLISIEKTFGRERKIHQIHWGPRSLDIDLLAWGDFQINTSELIIPHPRLSERGFVIIPLAEAIKKLSSPIIKIPPQEGWDE